MELAVLGADVSGQVERSEAYHYAVAQGYFGTEWTADIAGQTIEEG